VETKKFADLSLDMHKKHTIIDNILLSCLFFIFLSVSMTRHETVPVISSDPEGYYVYLPAMFVYDGVHHIPEPGFCGSMRNEKGEYYTKFTYGIALFYSPFFLVAHLYAHIFHVTPYGYSKPYQNALVLCGVFWAFVGLYLFKTLLLRYFSRLTMWITLLCIMLGTNFFNYATLEMGMSHVYSFALFAAVILVTDQYYKAPSLRKAMLIGLLMGWIVLVRPTNIALVIFLFLYKVVNAGDLKERWKFIKAHIAHLLAALPFFIVLMIPQMIYWKEMTGQWIKYSYNDERFIYWSHPKIASVLFDVENGLFLYSPVLLFLFWALFRKRKDQRTNFWGVSIVFVIITYLFASWDIWWFGGAFGHRCYVEYFTALGFPLAVTMEGITKLKKNLFKIPLFLFIALFCYYSVGMATIYLTYGIWDGPHWRWNWDGWIGLVKKIF